MMPAIACCEVNAPLLGGDAGAVTADDACGVTMAPTKGIDAGFMMTGDVCGVVTPTRHADAGTVSSVGDEGTRAACPGLQTPVVVESCPTSTPVANAPPGECVSIAVVVKEGEQDEAAYPLLGPLAAVVEKSSPPSLVVTQTVDSGCSSCSSGSAFSTRSP